MEALNQPLQVELGPLRERMGIGDLLRYERLAGIPLHRRFFVALTGVLLLAIAMLVALVWLDGTGILARVPLLGVFPVGYAVLAAVGFVWYAVDLTRRARLALFAWVNDWAYADALEGTRRPGSAFARTLRSRERGVVASDDERLPFELGRNFSIGTRDSGATVQRPFAFVELPLPVKVPHIVLKNRRRSIIPTFGLGRGGARMELEGEFAKHFLLLVPEGYQQDALYIFTPDLMARVIDLGAGAEIELVEDRLYVYLPGGTRFDRPATMEATLRLAEEFQRRFAARTELYRDDQAGDLAARAGVAIGLRGQRLAGSGISLMAVAATAGVLLLSAGVTAFSLFGGDLLRAWGAG
ncbi:hypothetical protein ACTJJ4_12460 [Microbacterium sp. 22195]|uniref:hypothetical protein n=1 Tax=Microbacterium sp. 22195 TaxID=3453891 RepID=UPI003F846D99